MATRLEYEAAFAFLQEGDMRIIEVRCPARIEIDDDGTVSLFAGANTLTVPGPHLPEAA